MPSTRASPPHAPTTACTAPWPPIDEDWNPAVRGWTVDRQRHYAYLTQPLADGALLKAVTAGVTRHCEDIGRWLATQQQGWNRLNTDQQARLGALGITPARVVRTRQAPAKIHVRAGRGSLPQRRDGPREYLAREGGGVPGRSQVEHLRDGREHRTGVWLADQRQRRDRLDAARLEALAELGVQWAR
ncbi:hypothetical protein ABTX82_32550 [Streptomyces lavendulae]|uniref:hypothetical protein n=1 Tax=Streptomyces lavendulae TaxID=1914 RepID=UPI00331C7FCE